MLKNVVLHSKTNMRFLVGFLKVSMIDEQNAVIYFNSVLHI